MRVIVLEFLDTDVFQVSKDSCVAFLDPLVESWNVDLNTFRLHISLNAELVSDAHRTFAFVECEPAEDSSWESVLADFLDDPHHLSSERHLVHGHVYAIDGSGLNDEWRLICLVCVSARRPMIVAWRLLSGEASEKGKEARVTRSLVEQAIALGGAGCIELLLMDALYADGPLLAWLKYQQNIDAIVPIPSDRELHRDLVGLVEGGLLPFTSASYTCTQQGHKQRRTLEFAWQDGLTGWDSFVSAAIGYGAVEPCLWGCLIRSPAAALDGNKETWTIVSTRSWRDGMAAWQGYRPRWHIENDAYRELKEGWRLESQRWGRDEAVQRGRVTLTCLAFNTAQVYISQAGPKLAARGIRRLRRLYQPELGAAPAVIYVGRSFAVLPLEELLAVLGRPATVSLRSLNHCVRPP